MHHFRLSSVIASIFVLAPACTVDKNSPATSDTDPDSSSSSTGVGGESTGTTDPDQAALDAVFEDAVSQGFTGVALVRRDGEVLFHEAAGLADRENNISLAPETPVVIGSITKQFTGAAVLLLHERGLLELDDSIGTLLPGVPDDKAGITVHQLLTHTSGAPGLLGPDDEEIGRDAYLQRFFDTPLEMEPGGVYSYSNTGYSVLAAIIEDLSGKGYQQFLHDEFFDPLGMHETGHLLPAWDGLAPALGYLDDMVDDPLARPHDASGYYWNLRGNGGLISTAEDLLLWDDALSTPDAILSADSLELLTTPYVSEGDGAPTFYGYGWVVEDTPVGTMIWHDGGNGYFYSHLHRYVDANLQVVVLANENTDAADTLPRQLAQAVSPELVPDTWEILFLQEGLLDAASETIDFEVEVAAGETHLAAVTLLLTEGTAAWRLLGPDGAAVEDGTATPDTPQDGFFLIDGDPGTWRLEVDLEAATGESLFGWGRLIGQGAPCPDGAECVELPAQP